MINGETLRALIKDSKKTRVLTITVTIKYCPGGSTQSSKTIKRYGHRESKEKKHYSVIVYLENSRIPA